MSRSQADPLRVRRGNPVERSRKVSERLPNPAKTLADLPPGATITLHGWEERVEGLDRLVLGVLIKTRDGKTLADVRAIGIPGIDFEIANADAEHGWGPLAYDILMEKVTSLHSELGPGDASADALRVWDYYETSRPDVEMSAHGFTFTKKPKLLLKLAKMPNVVYEGDWKRPSRRAKSTRLPNPGNPVERTAHDHAEALARAISAQPGAPRVRAWSKPGVGARVYFANGDFVSVGRGGSLQATSRGRATFLESSLFPAQRAAYRAGVAAYLAELDAYFDEEASRHENPVKRKTMTTPSRPAKVQHFLVRSPAEGLRVIRHPAIVENFAKALRVRPKHANAVLVPCAGTKPFPEAPSHKSGYLPALEGKRADVWVVSEPLGVVPYAWSRTWPNDAYDFPPKYLRGAAREALVERIGEWLDKVAPRYTNVYLALPGHHRRLLDEALAGRDLKIRDVGHGACIESGACPAGHGRATSHAYRGYLQRRIPNPVSDAALDPGAMSGDELRAALRGAGQVVSGSRAALEARLRRVLEVREKHGDLPVEDLQRMTVPELKAVLRRMDRALWGTKAQLVARAHRAVSSPIVPRAPMKRSVDGVLISWRNPITGRREIVGEQRSMTLARDWMARQQNSSLVGTLGDEVEYAQRVGFDVYDLDMQTEGSSSALPAAPDRDREILHEIQRASRAAIGPALAMASHSERPGAARQLGEISRELELLRDEVERRRGTRSSNPLALAGVAALFAVMPITPVVAGATAYANGRKKNPEQLGYKVIHRAGNRLISLADPRQSSPAKVGATMRMPGAGLFLSTNRDFVLAYYSDIDEELAPGVEEVLLTLSFEPRDVLSGNVEDREPVLTVRSARIVAIEPTHVRHPAAQRPRFAFLGQCDKLRRGSPSGERAWQAMMAAAQPVSRREFQAHVDLTPLLDEGESPGEWFGALGDASTYRSTWGGRDAYFVQAAGFEFIFVEEKQ